MKDSIQTQTLGLIFLFGYLAFIPTGPYPVFIIGGLKLDVLMGGALLFFLCFYFNKMFEWPDILLMGLVIYFSIVLLSSLLSDDVMLSMKYSVIMIGYALIAFLAPVVFEGKFDVTRIFLFVVAVLLGILIISLYTFFGFAHSHRFALALADVSSSGHGSQAGVFAVDSNMTAAGLILSLIVYFPQMFKYKRYILWEAVGSLCIVVATFITLSRSAFVGLVVSFLTAAIIVSIKYLFEHRLRVEIYLIRNVLIFVWLFFGFCVFFNMMYPDLINSVFQRLNNSSNDSSRLDLLVNAWDVFYVTPKSLLIGNGFMTTNPHNEFMRVLSTMGSLGLVSSLLFLVTMFYYVLMKTAVDNRLLFSSISIIFFILIITLFYGYTKLIWVAWMFLLFLYREASLDQTEVNGKCLSG